MYKKIIKRNFNISEKEIKFIIYDTFNQFDNIINNVIKNIPIDLLKITKLNPPYWEIGHIIFFWEYLVIKNIINNNYKNNIFKIENKHFDSMEAELDARYDISCNINIFIEILENIKNYLLSVENNKINNYLIYLGCMHQHMHIESLIYTQDFIKNYNSIKNNNVDENIPDIEWIDIPSNYYNIGAKFKNNKDFFFDNEAPQKKVYINKFTVSKYKITVGQYKKFLKDYEKNKKPDIISHKYIRLCKNENCLDYKYNDGNNMPARVNWYQANAFCNFYGYRLLKEYEWEYLADNKENANFNYNNPISVYKDKNINRFGVYGLYGNYWEWCEETIYPYDGYTIDPVYREYSYPFFGYKKVCRGGSWCCPDYLITRTYRNAQLPECSYQFISFRICK